MSSFKIIAATTVLCGTVLTAQALVPQTDQSPVAAAP